MTAEGRDARPEPGSATVCLARIAEGDLAARDQLFDLAYAELRAQAAAYLGRERAGHTLQPTALVHEAWVRLVHQSEVAPESRHHFLALAARAMRQVLVDHARTRQRLKRGGEWQRVELTDAAAEEQDALAVDLLVLAEGLDALREQSPRKAEVVELRFFGGLTVEETAEVMGVSNNTVDREWRVARAWLANRMDDGAER